MSDTHLLTASNRTKCGIDIDGLFRNPRVTSLREDVTCSRCDPDARPLPKKGSLEYLLRQAFDAGIVAQAAADVQRVGQSARRGFLEARYAEFRRRWTD